MLVEDVLTSESEFWSSFANRPFRSSIGRLRRSLSVRPALSTIPEEFDLVRRGIQRERASLKHPRRKAAQCERP